VNGAALRKAAAAMRTYLAGILALLAVIALAACGGDDGGDDTVPAETTVAAAGCGEIEEVDVEPFGNHAERDFTAADYETNPPSGGDHNPTPLEAGAFYTKRPPRLGEAVHLLEHGAVIGWTNDVSPEDLEAIEDEFNAIFQDGYYQLAVVENPELDVPFALSAWGALQTCEEVDTSAIRPFVEAWYASPKSGESALACEGQARRLPPC
jgi:hypothetical protein